MNKILIAYFSASGETGKLAKTLSAVTGGVHLRRSELDG